MADGAAEEDAVGEVGDLEGHDWGGMSGVTDFVVEGEEFFEEIDMNEQKEDEASVKSEHVDCSYAFNTSQVLI